MDKLLTIKQAREKVKKFVDDRDWSQFHSPKNMSMDIAVEAAELMELFMWVGSKESYKTLDEKRTNVEDEVADIFMGILALCNSANIDLAKAFESKLKKTEEKYPVEKSKGKNTKYTDL